VALGVVDRAVVARGLPVVAAHVVAGDREDRIAVRRDVAAEAERLAQRRVDQVRVRGAGTPFTRL